MTWDELRERLGRQFKGEDLNRLERAHAFAEERHRDQRRLSGDPYVTHAVETAAILLDLHSDPDTVAAALLHDTLEDTSATHEELEAAFGREVTELVEGVTKISTRVFRDSEEQKAENLRKIMLAMVRDIRVVVIKLADRLHNMRTLEYLPQDKRLRLAKETLEIYAPLAHRLGMGRVKNELEDLSFRFLHPQEYVDLVTQVAAFEEPRHRAIQTVRADLERLLAEAGIEGLIQDRMKHLFSLWNKMQFQKKDLDQIYDLMALRVIVPTIRDCYAVVGIVHAHWKPMPGRFKDFIAMPKSNMYQSLHTTVIGPNGEPLEIQIRTTEMHQTSEEGIAAHWSYKEGGNGAQDYEAKLSWFRQFLDWQQDLRDSKEFMEALKIDLFEDEVFVFTPKGEVKSLRRGSTPIDFAYLIHSRIGDTLIGAKVNGRMVPLKYELKNGDIVEVVTRADGRPSRDWLAIVRSTKAKNRIRHYFRQLDREEKIIHGKTALEAELQRCGTTFAEVVKKDRLLETANKMNYTSIDELLIQIGDGNLSARTVAAKLDLTPLATPPAAAPPTAKPQTATEEGVSVLGLPGLVTRFAQCCHPIPGDPIVGYVTQGRGVSIHRRDCPNLLHMPTEGGRVVAVSWDDMKSGEHVIQIFVSARDRDRLLADLLQVFYDTGTMVRGTETRTTRDHLAEGTFTVHVKGQEHLQELVRKLEKVRDVLRVARKG